MQPISNDKPLTAKFDSIFAALAVILFLGGFYLSSSLWFAGSAWYVRFLIVAVSIASSIAVLWPSSYRQRLMTLAKGARIELYKVFWPSKDESVRTTLLVLLIVTVFAIFFSIVDGLLTLIIKWVL